MNRIEDLITALQKKEEEKNKNTVLWVLAIIGAVAAIAGIAYASLHRIIWKILKKTLMMISMTILKTKMRTKKINRKETGSFGRPELLLCNGK